MLKLIGICILVGTFYLFSFQFKTEKFEIKKEQGTFNIERNTDYNIPEVKIRKDDDSLAIIIKKKK